MLYAVFEHSISHLEFEHLGSLGGSVLVAVRVWPAGEDGLDSRDQRVSVRTRHVEASNDILLGNIAREADALEDVQRVQADRGVQCFVRRGLDHRL
jgi:hypothetical protein